MRIDNKNVLNETDESYGDEEFLFKVPNFGEGLDFSQKTSPALNDAKKTLSASQSLDFKLFENGKLVDFQIIKSNIENQINFDQKLAKIKNIQDAMVGEIEIYLKNYETGRDAKSKEGLKIYESIVMILLQLNLYLPEIGKKMEASGMSENHVKQKIDKLFEETAKNFNGYNTVLAFLEVIVDPNCINNKLKNLESIHQKFKDYASQKNDYLQGVIRQFNTTNDENQKKQILAEFKKFIDGDIKILYNEVYNEYLDYRPHFMPIKVSEFFANFEFAQQGTKDTFVNLTNKGYDLATSLIQNAKDIYDEVISAYNQMYNIVYPDKKS